MALNLLTTTLSRFFRREVAEVGKRNLTELIEAGGIAALMALLKDLDPNCQRDALVALFTLLPKTAIPIDQLPLQTVLDFLGEMWPIDVRNAAAGLLDLMANDIGVCTDKIVKTEGALKATLNSLEKIPDDPCGQRVVSGLLEMAKEHQSFRLQIAESGLCDLVKYMRHQSGNEFEELLTDMLVLFCRFGETCQDAVVKADGHVILLTSLQENNLKEKAAQGLLELLKYTKTREKVLEAGFVTKVMNAIAVDVRFACTDIVLGLDRISSTPEGLNHIYLDDHSVQALLNLLQRCPEPKVKGTAALVMARLYLRLNPEDDAPRQVEIAVACKFFFKYLDPLDIPYSMELLEALAAIAAETKGRQMIHEERDHETLINHLQSVNQPDIQGLMLKILAVMTSDVSKNEFETRVVKNIRNSCMEHEVADVLLHLFQTDEFNRRIENMKYALILIRNLSLSGSYFGSSKRNKVLLLCYLRGIKSTAAILKLNGFGLTSRAQKDSMKILIAFAEDSQICKVTCKTIFESDILSALNRIICDDETNFVRYQAAVLMKLLAMFGPTKHVCSAMKKGGCVDALIKLRTVQDCNEMANDALNFLSEKSRVCKKYIDGRLSALDE